MWTPRFKFLKDRSGQEILSFALVLMLIVAIGAVLLTRTLLEQKRLNERRRELWRAFLHAEAGISQVQHWAFHPDSFTPDPNLFVRVSGETPAQKYPYLQAALDNGGIVITGDELRDMGEAGLHGLEGFTTESDWYLGRVKEIRIRPLGVDAPFDEAGNTVDPPSSAGAFFKIISVGEAAPTADAGGGGRPALTREVIGYATPTPVVEIEIAAPLVSLVSADAFGNARIHWGEAWSKTNFDVLNKSQMDYALSDPRVVWRTEGAFNFPANWSWSTTYKSGRLYTNFMNQSVLPGGRRPGLFPTGNGDWKDKFYQNVPAGVLEWPDLASQYQEFKDMAIANNRYYTTNAANQLLRDGEVADFYTEFTVPDRAEAPMELAFIDTIDGQPPAPDGSNLATLRVSGTSQGLKGFLYICANMDATGVGNPPSLTILNPNTGVNESLPNIFLDGVMYTAGTLALGGNAGIYGSIVAEKGFVGGGTPDIYYNIELADGLDLGGGNLGAPFQIVLHNNFAPES